ncbi:hypothetical protein [Gallibacterium anatis]|uniref:hypothetical protein n=1 Tax=Gallibacterium anatis TaxID=750 RepID=UPI0039FD5B03
MFYSDLADRIALESGGIPEIMLIQLIPICANDYFTDTRLWRRRCRLKPRRCHCAFNQAMSEDEYVVRVERVETPDGVAVPAITRNSAPHSHSLSYTFSTNGIEIHGNEDDVPDYFDVEVSLAPSPLAEEMPDELDHHARRGITALVLARAYLTPNREWTNNDLGTFYLKQYDQFVLDAKRLAQGGRANINRECAFSW